MQFQHLCDIKISQLELQQFMNYKNNWGKQWNFLFHISKIYHEWYKHYRSLNLSQLKLTFECFSNGIFYSVKLSISIVAKACVRNYILLIWDVEWSVWKCNQNLYNSKFDISSIKMQAVKSNSEQLFEKFDTWIEYWYTNEMLFQFYYLFNTSFLFHSTFCLGMTIFRFGM